MTFLAKLDTLIANCEPGTYYHRELLALREEYLKDHPQPETMDEGHICDNCQEKAADKNIGLGDDETFFCTYKCRLDYCKRMEESMAYAEHRDDMFASAWEE